MREAEHLGEVGERALAAVVLPVGVGDEAGRRVEGEVGRDGALAGGVERQRALETQQGVQDEEAAEMEDEHRDQVGDPALLVVLVDAGHAVEQPFGRPQHGGQDGALAREDAGHVAAEQRRDRDDDDAVERDLRPAYGSHGAPFQNRSGRTRA